MGRDFYQILNLPHNASPEEVRRAYRQRALETHPDRRRDSSEAATEEFRKVNNAYEVLSDPAKRQAYDAAGRVWPPAAPPVQEQQYYDPQHARPGRGQDPFSSPPFPAFPAFGRGFPFGADPFASDPFFARPPPFARSLGFGDPLGSTWTRGAHLSSVDPFGFTDPLALFDRVFSALGEDPFALMRGVGSPFGDGLFGGGVLAAAPPRGLLSAWPDLGSNHAGMQMQSATSGYVTGSGGRGWVSESRTMRTVNGVTETVVKRMDAQGNEHVTHTLPNGTVRTTANGVEQAPPIGNARRTRAIEDTRVHYSEGAEIHPRHTSEREHARYSRGYDKGGADPRPPPSASHHERRPR